MSDAAASVTDHGAAQAELGGDGSGPGYPVEPSQEHGDRLSAVVAVLIALATLVAAVVGYLQADSSNAANDRRLAAEQLSLQALASGQQAQQTAQVDYSTYARWVEQRTAAGSAQLRSLFLDEGSAEQAAALREQERWERVAQATARLTALSPDAEHGPRNDPSFPRRYFASAAEDSVRFNALQDAANEEALALDERAANLTAILAMLAVSLYLLGLTLAVTERWLQHGFLGVGVALLLVAGGWAALTVTGSTPASDDEAAAAYARGRIALLTAYDSGGFREAASHLDEAIARRPTFARAYADRASATFLGATPQRTGFASIVPPEALQAARGDLEAARDLGLRSAATFGSLGFYTFVEGTQAGDAALLEESIAFTRRAIARDPGEPVYRFNLGVALVAAGRLEEARAAYAEAVARTLYLDEEREQLRGETWIEEAWLAGALTDLEIVLAHQPERADEIRRLKEAIVGPISASTLEALPSSPATFSDLQLDVFPAEAQWQGTLNGYDAERDVVSVQWYHRGGEDLGWAVIPEISRPQLPRTGTDGRLFGLSAYIGAVAPSACLPPGRYRAEIYVNGRLAGLGETTPTFGPMEAFASRELTVAFCRPTDWQPLEDIVAGVIDGQISPDGERGVYALHYPMPRSWSQLEEVSTLTLDITIESFADSFPATPEYLEDPGTTADYFMGLDRTAWRWYDYGTGYVRAAAGVKDDGAVVVALVWGPYDWFDGDEPYAILGSLVRYE